MAKYPAGPGGGRLAALGDEGAHCLGQIGAVLDLGRVLDQVALDTGEILHHLGAEG